jgi:hypothetical protein
MTGPQVAKRAFGTYQINIVGMRVLFATKLNSARRAAGIPRRFLRHANVGIALAPRICLNKLICLNKPASLNKLVRSNQVTVLLG